MDLTRPAAGSESLQLEWLGDSTPTRPLCGLFAGRTVARGDPAWSGLPVAGVRVRGQLPRSREGRPRTKDSRSDATRCGLGGKER